MNNMISLPFTPTEPIPLPALHVWKRLREKGYDCFLTGGWVRDLWLKRKSSDVDLATSATPQEVMALFERCLPLGQRFGSVIVLIESEGEPTASVEVTTFRKDGSYSDGRRPDTVQPGTPLEDAERRDFTINGLFFDPETHCIIDYVGGLEDLHLQVIRAIGDPWKRFEEDRLRILRGVRLSTRLGFALDESTRQAMMSYSSSLMGCVSVERIWQEIGKMDEGGHLQQSLLLMNDLTMIESIFKLTLSSQLLKERLSSLQSPGGSLKNWSAIHQLARMWPLQALGLDEAVKALGLFKLSNREKSILEQLDSGLKLYHKDRELYEKLAWVRWLALSESGLNREWMAMALDDTDWLERLHELEKKPLTQLLIAQQSLVRAHHLEAFHLQPSPRLGHLLAWLHEQAAKMDLLDIGLLLRHLTCDAVGLQLLQRAQEGHSTEKNNCKKSTTSKNAPF